MSSPVQRKTYKNISFDKKEIMRYMGIKDRDTDTIFLEEYIKTFGERINYAVCYRVFDIEHKDSYIDLGFSKTDSKNLRKRLDNCKRIILFAATLGTYPDILINKYSKISPIKSLIYQAISAQQIERVIDNFCEDMEKIYGKLKPRFSPGYGDLPLDMQKDIFLALDCTRVIGISLNDSLLISPSKSVTAILGIV